jgi:hypothetical protein
VSPNNTEIRYSDDYHNNEEDGNPNPGLSNDNFYHTRTLFQSDDDNLFDEAMFCVPSVSGASAGRKLTPGGWNNPM